MADPKFKYRILVVDDDPMVRETSALVLIKEGFEVRTSDDGFSALVMLRNAPPDLIIADLRMPSMSGFELLSIVRRRFPQIPIIAISGEFNAGGPVGLLADAFFQKGTYRPTQLFIKIAELLKSSPLRASVVRGDLAPVWVPLNERGYFVLICTECLRSFSEPDDGKTDELCEVECVHCGAKVQYLRDSKRRKSQERSFG
jgi:CheY-like chemotaxis protein